MRRPSNLLCAGALAIAAAVVPAAPASAGPGDLDPTFGGDGIVDLRWEDGPSSGTLYSPRVDVGPRGAIWTASTTLQPDSDFRARVLVTKLRPDGSLDEAFAGSGQREWYLRRTGTAPSAPYSAARAVAALPTGGVQVSGVWTNEQAPVDRPRLFVLRLTKDGRLDPEFGRRGVVQQPFNEYATTTSTAAPDGSIASCAMWDGRVRVWRTTPDGSPDVTFGTDGSFTTRLRADEYLAVSSCTVTPEGGVLVAAIGGSGPPRTIHLLRLTPTGERDETYGPRGEIGLPVPADVVPYESSLRPHGGLAFAASSWEPDVADRPAVLAVTAAGAFDPSFGGGDGLAVMRGLPIEPLDKVHAAVGSDGSVVVAGYAGRELGEPATYVARFGPDGSVDRRFGDRGAVVDPAQGLWPVGDVVVDRSGRTLVGTFQRGREDVLNVLRLQ